MRKRLFFGVQAEGVWPQSPDSGRILKEEYRHITLSFLGDVEEFSLSAFPKLAPLLGVVGICKEIAPFGKAIAYKVDLLQQENRLYRWKEQIDSYLKELGFSLDLRPFSPHITIARGNFDLGTWKKDFSPFPIYTLALHLYESLGNMQYKPIWSLQALPPIEEIEHTADLAFLIRGESLQEIFQNAGIALALYCPAILSELQLLMSVSSLDEIIFALNDLIARVDASFGAPYKAVSFHGNLRQENGYKVWEMVVDV